MERDRRGVVRVLSRMLRRFRGGVLMTKPDWKNLLRELLTEAIQVEDLDTDDGAVWEMTISDERMAEFENMGLWNMESAGWND
jgi:hypothetical protein